MINEHQRWQRICCTATEHLPNTLLTGWPIRFPYRHAYVRTHTLCIHQWDDDRIKKGIVVYVICILENGKGSPFWRHRDVVLWHYSSGQGGFGELSQPRRLHFSGPILPWKFQISSAISGRGEAHEGRTCLGKAFSRGWLNQKRRRRPTKRRPAFA